MDEDPRGEITIQALAMPADTNANGDIFGGWLVSQMDLAAGILAKKISKGRAVTVAINSMSFLRPVHVGDLISCHVKLLKIGNTSMDIAVEVWTENLATGNKSCVTKGTFIFVAIDENGKSRKIQRQE
ncbi:acyl-CoA thioesterase YciA (plasmid) [Legionella adelaidensis]|uniref:Acyl-CoA thioester hydrolase n=1 Tax=Legionella adelaidensis TaxID=45056 RepID=A0A0W0R3V1_9GAMM|nr:acyl-CoA thioesterase [Legionella adelaidensis]KTC65708.1 acyl-CoA thioester hydrolase [Legionella adelaidensis]VEH85990.1 acyl-CoA thioesterase YciA [Legionella adelaidensis]